MPTKQIACELYNGTKNPVECLGEFISKNAAEIINCCLTRGTPAELSITKNTDCGITIKAIAK